MFTNIQIFTKSFSFSKKAVLYEMSQSYKGSHMNSTQKNLLFLFALTLTCFKLQAFDKQKSGHGITARPGTPMTTPLTSPKKTSPQYLTPPTQNPHLRSPALQPQQPPKAPRIGPIACMIIIEDTPTTPQPAGAAAAPNSAATPTHSAPATASLAGFAAILKSTIEVQRKPAMSAPSAKDKQLALHDRYLHPVNFIQQNKDNPEILADFYQKMRHFYVKRAATLGLPAAPFMLKPHSKQPQVRT